MSGEGKNSDMAYRCNGLICITQHRQAVAHTGCCYCRGDKFVMAYQQNELTALQQRLPFGKKLAGGVPGRVAMTLQDGATTTDILTGILQVHHTTHIYMTVQASSSSSHGLLSLVRGVPGILYVTNAM